MAFKATPIKSSFFAASIIGLLVSIFYIPKYSIPWAYAFGILFLLMIIASLISMRQATPDAQLYPKPKKVR
jgi:hypothetical protein